METNESVSKMIRITPAGKFLVDSGLLFAINMEILHPLGLALEVNTETGEVSSVWDCRDVVKEGIVFSSETFEEGKNKLATFLKEINANDRIEARKARLGYIFQGSEE